MHVNKLNREWCLPTNVFFIESECCYVTQKFHRNPQVVIEL